MVIVAMACTTFRSQAQTPDTRTPLAALKPDSSGVMSPVILGTSGLVFVDGTFWTHDDAGGCAVLYRIGDTSKKRTRELWLRGAANGDWEDLAQAAGQIYIADIGNNTDTARPYLRVYRFNVSETMHKPKRRSRWVEEYGLVRFVFPGGTTAKRMPLKDLKHTWNSEAMAVVGNLIYLFTKENCDSAVVARGECITRIYTLDLANFTGMDKDTLTVVYAGEMIVDGPITGAAYNQQRDRLALVGNKHRTYMPFVTIIDNFSQTGSRMALGTHMLSMQCAQVEAATWGPGGALYLSNENELGKERKVGSCDKLALPKVWRVQVP